MPRLSARHLILRATLWDYFDLHFINRETDNLGT